jgi:hypothetical protein
MTKFEINRLRQKSSARLANPAAGPARTKARTDLVGDFFCL